jgi:hypothetical protein
MGFFYALYINELVCKFFSSDFSFGAHFINDLIGYNLYSSLLQKIG